MCIACDYYSGQDYCPECGSQTASAIVSLENELVRLYAERECTGTSIARAIEIGTLIDALQARL